MLYTNNWEEMKIEYTKWWNRELEKPVLYLQTPKKNTASKIFDWGEWSFVSEKDDPELALKHFDEAISSQEFLGMSYPTVWLNLGPGVLAAYITGFLGFDGSAVWFEQPMEWDKIEESIDMIDANNEWWQYTLRLAEIVAKHSQNKYSVGTTDMGGTLDILASLRGTQTLLFDLIDQPERVIAAENKILKLWYYVYNTLNERMEKYLDGYNAWMNIWCPRTWYPIQEDFSAMISPTMFEKFAAPYVSDQAKTLDYSIYHLDGPGELPNLDIILGIDEIDGIQWVPGAGNDDVTSEKFYDIYRRIQAKGKNLVINGADPKRIPELFKHISTKGVLVTTYCENKEDVDELMDWYSKY